MNTAKRELRSKYRQIRLSMDDDEVNIRSQVICQKVIEVVDWTSLKTISVFQPITRLNEVKLSSLLTDVKRLYPDIKIDMVGQSKNQVVPKKKFDLILVPCLAFDKDNYRLGWGGGFYDRFLVQQPQALKIGVSYRNGFTDSGLPHEPHDIPLDRVITEA